MRKLSEFAEQKHITAVLRASIIDGDPIRDVILLGGDQLERCELAEAYIFAASCLHPMRGDHCGNCGSCNTGAKIGRSYTWVSTHESFDAPAPIGTEVFYLKDASPVQSVAYGNALVLLGRIVSGMPDYQLLTGIEPEGTIVFLAQVLLDLIAKKSGADILADSELATVLSAKLSTRDLVKALDVIWDWPDDSRINESTALRVVITKMKYQLHVPASDDATEPINSVDAAPISPELLEALARELS